MGYVEKNLTGGERVLYKAKIHWIVFATGFLLLTTSFILIGTSPLMGVILFLLGIISLINALIFRISTELAVTSKRVIAKVGLISRHTMELNHSKVESFNVEQSVVGRLFGFGTIIINGTGGGITPIPNIDSPLEFRRIAMDIIDFKQSRQRMRKQNSIDTNDLPNESLTIKVPQERITSLVESNHQKNYKKRFYPIMLVVLIVLIAGYFIRNYKDTDEMWVKAKALNIRTCPSLKCGIISQLKFREKVDVYEIKNGWARISEYSIIRCKDGITRLVTSGNNTCTNENGIIEGEYAKWVSENYLSKNQPELIPTKKSNRERWVKSRKLERRTCPSDQCGTVGRYFYRQRVSVYEERDGWARITQYYEALCEDGIIPFVEKDNNQCTPNNGVIDDKLAEWVRSSGLSDTKPKDHSKTAVGDEMLVSTSDDFDLYRKIFTKTALSLIDSGKCTKEDFKRGSWIKSTNYRDAPVYFIHCGVFPNSKRIYLNAETGEILPH